MEVKKIIGSLKKRGIKGSYLRWKNGNPKINTIDFGVLLLIKQLSRLIKKTMKITEKVKSL